MNTIEKQGDDFLVGKVSARRAESLLTEWANIRTEYPADQRAELAASGKEPWTDSEKSAIAQTDAAIARLMKRYPEVFASFPAVLPPPPDAETIIATEHWFIVAPVQRFLRLAWEAPGIREREWHIFQARREYYFSTVVEPLWRNRMAAAAAAGVDLKQEIEMGYTPEEDRARTSPPAFTPFEQVMYHFHRVADRARRCNNPECPAPFFFAAKRGQRYCSSKCSAPAQREQKREWWRRNRAKQTD